MRENDVPNLFRIKSELHDLVESRFFGKQGRTDEKVARPEAGPWISNVTQPEACVDEDQPGGRRFDQKDVANEFSAGFSFVNQATADGAECTAVEVVDLHFYLLVSDKKSGGAMRIQSRSVFKALFTVGGFFFLYLTFARADGGGTAAGTMGGGLDAASQEALEKTQRMLENAQSREAAIQKTGDRAVEVDQRVKELGGSADQTQKIYQLASEIFGDLAKEAGGDPIKLMQMMEAAQKNPEAFGNKLSPAAKAKIHQLSLELPASQQQQAPAALKKP